MSKLDELLRGIREETRKIHAAGEQTALAGSKENPDAELKEAELSRTIAEINILGHVGRFLDQWYTEEE